MSRVIFPAMYVGDVIKLTFDFTSVIAIGETISTATLMPYVFSGNESSPSLSLGAGTISGNQVTSLASGGQLGTTYDCECDITTSAGQTTRLQGYLTIAPKFV